jgi:hypothetical protein
MGVNELTPGETIATIADRLPDQPLKPATINDIARQLDWSALVIPAEIDGVKICPESYLFAPDERAPLDDGSIPGTALGLRFDGDEWVGESMRTDVVYDNWIKVNQQFADVLDRDLFLNEIVAEIDGELVERSFDDLGGRSN